MLRCSAELKVGGKKEERFLAPQTHPERPDRIVGVNAKRAALRPEESFGMQTAQSRRIMRDAPTGAGVNAQRK